MSEDLTPTFQRSLHNRENPYAQISKDLLQNAPISPECRWLISFLLSHPDNWVIKLSYIENKLKGFKGWGIKRIYKVVREGVAAGYILHEKYLVKNLTRHRYFVSETPIFSNNFSDSAFFDASAEAAVNKYKDIKKKEKEEKKEGAIAPPSAPPPSLFSFERVKMPQEKYDNLVKEFGKEKVNSTIEDLNGFADINPKKFNNYGCHSGVIRAWIKRDMKKEGIPKESLKIKHEELAKKICDRFPEKLRSGEIILGYNYLEFSRGHFINKILFDDAGFKEQALNALRKMNLSTEGL